MKIVKIVTGVPGDELASMINNQELVNERVLFDEKKGKPEMRVRQKGDRFHITCEYIGGDRRDNGFLVGSFFSGKIRERKGRTVLSGIILTAPLYHLFLLVLIGIFVWRCISLGGINPVPIILVGFSILMFWGEFKKQGVIYRYLHRAARRAEAEHSCGES